MPSTSVRTTTHHSLHTCSYGYPSCPCTLKMKSFNQIISNSFPEPLTDQASFTGYRSVYGAKHFMCKIVDPLDFHIGNNPWDFMGPSGPGCLAFPKSIKKLVEPFFSHLNLRQSHFRKHGVIRKNGPVSFVKSGNLTRSASCEAQTGNLSSGTAMLQHLYTSVRLCAQ